MLPIHETQLYKILSSSLSASDKSLLLIALQGERTHAAKTQRYYSITATSLTGAFNWAHSRFGSEFWANWHKHCLGA